MVEAGDLSPSAVGPQPSIISNQSSCSGIWNLESGIWNPIHTTQPARRPRRVTPAMPAPLSLPRRYLVPFDPRDLPHHFADVLIIGGGLAGLRAALGLPESLRALVVTKDEVRESNSSYAQGGIAGVLDPEDRFDDHIADTLAAGKGLCDPEVVATVVREAPERIAELIRWGTHFDEVDGSVALTREGGHSHAR